METPLKGIHNIVLLGEPGSGKTELALNLAVAAAKEEGRPVDLFDMDQTKPMYRSRDLETMLAEAGVSLHQPIAFQDAPVIPAGVRESILDANRLTLFDVGGGPVGALTMGQFSNLLADDDTLVFYTVNPYRAFAETAAQMKQTLERILGASRLRQVRVVANPNLGGATRWEDVKEGYLKTKRAMAELGLPIAASLMMEGIQAPEGDPVLEEMRPWIIQRYVLME